MLKKIALYFCICVLKISLQVLGLGRVFCCIGSFLQHIGFETTVSENFDEALTHLYAYWVNIVGIVPVFTQVAPTIIHTNVCRHFVCVTVLLGL